MTGGSQALAERAARVFVDGGNSASRGPRVFDPWPPCITRAEGCRLHDADGNDWIDWMNAFGAVSTGHAHPEVVRAVQEAAATGAHFATAIPEEVALAERLVAIVPAAQKVRFASTGTEAAMAAVRLARGVTGRRKILKFEGHYHGWADALLVTTNPQPVTTLGHPHDPVGIVDSSGIPPGAVADTIVAPWNDIDILERVFRDRGREIACAVTEGVMANIGVIPPRPGYLERLQRLCRDYDALFYLDETVTGFRLAPGGCAEAMGLSPDIVTFGKALGQGYPLAAICARAELMDGLAWGNVMHFGTFNGHRVGVLAALAGLDVLGRDDNAGFRRLTEVGQAAVAGIRDVLARQDRHPAICQSAGSLFQIFFTEAPEIADFRAYCRHVDGAKFTRFANRLRAFGVFINPSNTLHCSSSIAITDADVDATVSAVARALDSLD